MDEKTADEIQRFRDDMSIIHDVAYRVRKFCNSEKGLDWIAKQSVSEHQPYDDLYGFVIGRGFASVRVQDARNATDDLIRQLATEIMGYAPDSLEDLVERKKNAKKHIAEHEEVIRKAQASLRYWRSVDKSLAERIGKEGDIDAAYRMVADHLGAPPTADPAEG